MTGVPYKGLRCTNAYMLSDEIERDIIDKHVDYNAKYNVYQVNGPPFTGFLS